MAAGNDAGDAANNHPGCVNDDKVFTVASIDCDDNCSFYSNYGAAVDWLAVGTNVFSTYRARGQEERYTLMSGTSMSTAIVTGIIHANGGPPIQGPSIECGGSTYYVAKRN
jgi:subtilisin family serine protease